jgi:hypothetical protein
MKYIVSTETLTVPEDVNVSIRSRVVTVEGPRGKLVKDLSHIAVTFVVPKKQTIQVRSTSATQASSAPELARLWLNARYNQHKRRMANKRSNRLRSTTAPARMSLPCAQSSQSSRTSSPV